MRCHVLHSPNHKQSGLALITVLFIFALVSLMAMSMQKRQAMDIAQASSTFAQAQAMQYIYSAEELAKSGLLFDLSRDQKSGEEWDTASELWNQSFTTKVDRANIELNIRDLQGLFNLNWLHPSAPNPTQASERLQRLISEAGHPSLSSEVARNLKNWFTSGSSFNYIYENKEPPYRASEMEMVHPSELKLVEGVTEKLYEDLEPYITALPYSVQLNINTTTPEVLASWAIGLSEHAQDLVAKSHSGVCGQGRSTYVYPKVEDFIKEPKVDALLKPTGTPAAGDSAPAAPLAASDFTVKTNYFSVLMRITMDIDGDAEPDIDLTTESIVKRSSDFTGVIYRDYSREVKDFTELKKVNCT